MDEQTTLCARSPDIARGGPARARVAVPDLATAFRDGRISILHCARTDVGYFAMPAQRITPRDIAFMACHGGGIVSVVLTSDRAGTLGLMLQPRRGGARRALRFATPIDARHGVTTGISASDRALTALVAADPACGPDAIDTPGHLPTIVVHPADIYEESNHGAAAVRLCRMAGLEPCAVVSGILDGDGRVAPLAHLEAFARRHDIPLGSVDELAGATSAPRSFMLAPSPGGLPCRRDEIQRYAVIEGRSGS